LGFGEKGHGKKEKGNPGNGKGGPGKGWDQEENNVNLPKNRYLSRSFRESLKELGKRTRKKTVKDSSGKKKLGEKTQDYGHPKSQTKRTKRESWGGGKEFGIREGSALEG